MAGLLASGVVNDSIVFTTDTTEYPDVRFRIEAIHTPSFVLEYCVVESGIGDEFGLRAAVHGVSSTIAIRHTSFRFNRGNFDGGALTLWSCSHAISHCEFVGNRSEHFGGALQIFNSTAGTVEHCLFSANSADNGGALDAINEWTAVRNCEFVGNTAESRGGAVIVEGSGEARFENCVFRDNSAQISGGAIASEFNDWSTITACVIENNVANESGGGIVLLGSRPTIDRCLIRGNQAEVGGGIHVFPGNNLGQIVRCTFAENRATQSGAGLACTSPPYWITVTTTAFVGHSQGSAIHNPPPDTARFSHCSFWENTVDFSGNFDEHLGVVDTFNRNADPCDRFYNLFADPRLVDLAGGDFHLTENSPLIDAGRTPNEPPFIGSDPDSTIADIGAFYFDQTDAANVTPFLTREFGLLQNYPNPFNATTTMAFEIPSAGRVRLRVFDLSGRIVATIADRIMETGRHAIRWDAKNAASGVYVIQLEANGVQDAGKAILLK